MFRRLPRSVRIALRLAVGPAIVLVAFVIYYSPHLLWRLSSEYSLTQHIQAVPVRSLEADAPTTPFRRCQLGPIGVSVPPEMVDNTQSISPNKRGALLGDSNRKIYISLPSDNSITENYYRQESEVNGGRTSVPQIQAEWYTASSEDFRWSMSSDELRRHKWLMNRCFFGRVSNVKTVETLFGGEVEGLLLVVGKYAHFEWYWTKQPVSGMLVFESKNEKLDLDWVRQVCASLTCSGGPVPENLSQAEVSKLFKIE